VKEIATPYEDGRVFERRLAQREITAAEDANAVLRATLGTAERAVERAVGEAERLRREVAGLEAERAKYSAGMDVAIADRDAMGVEAERLRAENKRLRRALKPFSVCFQASKVPLNGALTFDDFIRADVIYRAALAAEPAL
jgi:hypothetical protein